MNFRPIIFILVSAAALTALFIALKPAPAPHRGLYALSAPHDTDPIVQAAQQPSLKFELNIKGGALTSGPRRIEVPQGSAIELKVTTDHADELHLHGYDLKFQLTADESATLVFSADHSGRFGLELHHSHSEIATLEVMPTP